MPVVVDDRMTQQRTKSLIRTEAKLGTIYLLWQFLQCRPRLMLAYFYEIQMTFPETASKTLSHIQSTAKYILLRETLLLILTPLATL